MAGIGRTQCSNQHPERVRAWRGAQSRDGHARKRRNGSGLWKARTLGRFEVDHEADHGGRLIGKATEPEPADFDQAGKRRGRPHQQAALDGFDVHAVVANEPRERQYTVQPGLDQREGEPRLSRARRPADQYGARTDEDSRGVERR